MGLDDGQPQPAARVGGGVTPTMEAAKDVRQLLPGRGCPAVAPTATAAPSAPWIDRQPIRHASVSPHLLIYSFTHLLLISARSVTQKTPRRISQPGSFGPGQMDSLFPGQVTRCSIKTFIRLKRCPNSIHLRLLVAPSALCITMKNRVIKPTTILVHQDDSVPWNMMMTGIVPWMRTPKSVPST